MGDAREESIVYVLARTETARISNLASTTTVRLLTAHDIPQALELSSGAGWNQTSEDWRTLIELEPESCFAMECATRSPRDQNAAIPLKPAFAKSHRLLHRH
jgi:hypothetical protein